MRTIALEVKKLQLKKKLTEIEWKKEQDLIHRWSMLVIKVGMIVFGIIFLIKLGL